jgi:F-type H+-transporting ATPase subunit delta
MQNNTTIARPYARAAFEQAQQESKLEEWSSLLKVLVRVVQDPQMRRLLSSPKVGRQQILDLISGVYRGQLSSTATNFIKVLIHTRRLRYVSHISSQFEEKRAEAESRVDINVVTAYELEADQASRISAAMGKRLGKKITISSTVDKSLIGGMIIRAGDSVIDASLRGRLTRLRNELIG